MRESCLLVERFMGDENCHVTFKFSDFVWRTGVVQPFASHDARLRTLWMSHLRQNGVLVSVNLAQVIWTFLMNKSFVIEGCSSKLYSVCTGWGKWMRESRMCCSIFFCPCYLPSASRFSLQQTIINNLPSTISDSSIYPPKTFDNRAAAHDGMSVIRTIIVTLKILFESAAFGAQVFFVSNTFKKVIKLIVTTSDVAHAAVTNPGAADFVDVLHAKSEKRAQLMKELTLTSVRGHEDPELKENESLQVAQLFCYGVSTPICWLWQPVWVCCDSTHLMQKPVLAASQREFLPATHSGWGNEKWMLRTKNVQRPNLWAFYSTFIALYVLIAAFPVLFRSLCAAPYAGISYRHSQLCDINSSSTSAWHCCSMQSLVDTWWASKFPLLNYSVLCFCAFVLFCFRAFLLLCGSF